MTFNILQPTFKLLWEVNFSGNILFSLTTIWQLCPGLNASVFLVNTSCMKEFFTIFTALHIWQNYVCSVELLSMRTLNHACVKEPEILDISAIWRQLQFLFSLEFSSSPSDGAPQYFPKYFLLKIIFLQVSMFFDLAQLLKLMIYQSWRDMQISQLRFKKTMFEVQLVILLVNWICSSVAVSNRSDVSTRFNVRWQCSLGS